MRRWGLLVGFVAAVAVLVPLATAGAQAPSTVGGETPTVEGSSPPGGTVDCTTGATLSPPAGPPGTVVTVSTTFQGNCDEIDPSFLAGMTCSGSYQVQGNEALNFEMTVDEQGNATGTFAAPVTEPDPPVVDAVEPVTVTVTCFLGATPASPPAEGPVQGTTYVYPPENFDLELFANPDGDQPTLIDNDPDVTGGVVSAAPPFAG